MANLVAIKGSSVGIMVIAPSVFFVSLASAYRGYFQGRQNMYPTALSEVVESTTKMLVGLIAAGWIMGMTVDGSLGQTIDLAAHKIASAHVGQILIRRRNIRRYVRNAFVLSYPVDNIHRTFKAQT